MRRVVRSKCADNDLQWYPSKPRGAYRQSFWRFIHKGWERFYHHFFPDVGVGSSILFWHDRWCQEGPLRDLFPSLYVLVVNIDATIANYCQCGLGAVVWPLVVIRDAFVDDTRLVAFLNKLNEITPHQDLNSKGVHC